MPPRKTTPSINRELSWLSFNERVLQEAADERNPLIERVRFLGIFSNNLDEFFRVRVATVRRMSGLSKRDKKQLEDDPKRLLQEITAVVKKLQAKREKVFLNLERQLKKNNIHIIDELNLTDKQQAFVRSYFNQHIKSLLSPVVLGPKIKFPNLKDSNIYLAVQLLFSKSEEQMAIIDVPSSVPRFIELPREEGKHYVIFLDDVIRFHLHDIFSILKTKSAKAYTIKISRDAEIDMDDDISKGIVQKMSKGLDRRKKGNYTRMLYDEAMPAEMLASILRKTLMSDDENVIPGGKYHNKKDFMRFPDFGKKSLVFPRQNPLTHPRLADGQYLLDEVLKGDILLHYPYQSFGHVEQMLHTAALDPNVRTIRINLYRVAAKSSIIRALLNAAQNGKLVTVMIELQARFDEENNIHWSNKLAKGGVKVLFGVTGLKVHSKLILISRKVKGKTVRVAHIGTGNFHESTARVYEDVSLFTADKRLCNEVKKVFSLLEITYDRSQFRHLMVSPFGTRRKFVAHIDEEIKAAKKGNEARIRIKLNNLVDEQLIQKLYDASAAGVQVQLLIRGICGLQAGVKGLSENIEARSVVGRYLEHSRIMEFHGGGKPKYFISSADWMTRNLDHRIEVTAPIYDEALQRQIHVFLDNMWADNTKARILDSKLSNKYVEPKGKAKSGQSVTYSYFRKQLD